MKCMEQQKIEDDVLIAGDRRPTFRQLLELHDLTLAEVAQKANITLLQAERLYQLLPVFVEDADQLLQALSDLTGQLYTRAEVGRIYFRTDYERFKTVSQQMM